MAAAIGNRMPSTACRRRLKIQVSRSHARQRVLRQEQIGYGPLQSSVRALKILHLPRLIDREAAGLLAPAVIARLRDFRLLARATLLPWAVCTSICPQLQHGLLRARLLTSPHVRLLG